MSACQGLGALVVREEIEEFVAEDGDAAGLESDDRDAGFDFGLELVENFEQQRLSAVEHAEIVEGAAAAEIRLREEDAVSGGFQNFDGGFGGGGQEIVVEGVGPEEDRQGLKPVLSLAIDAALKGRSSTASSDSPDPANRATGGSLRYRGADECVRRYVSCFRECGGTML